MKAYELLYFVVPTIDDNDKKSVSDRIESTIKESKGTIDNVNELGKRPLAYEINDSTEGDYILVDFHSDPASVAELDRVLRINDFVQRHMIVRRSDRN